MIILANIKDKISRIVYRRELAQKRRAWLLLIFFLFFFGGWLIFEFWINNSAHYLRLANNELGVITRGQAKSVPESAQIIKKNLRRAIVLGAKDPMVAGAAASISDELAKYDVEALDLAMNYYDLFAQLEPGNAAPVLRLAQLRMGFTDASAANIRTEGYKNALILADKAIQLEPKFAEAHYVRALLHEKLGEFDLAIEAAKTSQLLAQNDRVSFTLARLMYNRGASLRAQGVNAKFHENKDLKQVRAIIEPLAEQGPEQLNALYLLAELEQRLGNKSAAKKYATTLIGLLPEGEKKSDIKNKFNKVLEK